MNQEEKATAVEHHETTPPVVLNQGDDLVSFLISQDKTPWYKKPNLRHLYLLFIGSILCIETTSGYDASVTNGLQSVPKWVTCEYPGCASLIWEDFGKPAGTILGLIGSMYALGVSNCLYTS
jgi:hypothetical protein